MTQQPSISPPHPPHPNPWRAAAAGLAILVLVAAIFGAVSFARVLDLNDSVETLEDRNRSLSNEVTALRGKVNQLQNQLNELESGPFLYWVTGTVSTPGTGVYILFDAQGEGTTSSAIYSDNSFQVWLIGGKTYTVNVYYNTLFTNFVHCIPRPSLFTPSQADTTEAFTC